MSTNISFAINHITCPHLRYDELIELAVELGCHALQFRNDLGRPLFEGDKSTLVKQQLHDAGLRMLSLAEVKRFNDTTPERVEQAKQLIEIAVECGAEGISLIPCNDAAFKPGPSGRIDNLRSILEELAEPLEDAGLKGMVEPLGFGISSLPSKAEAVDVISELDLWGTYQLVHDSFHHHLAGEENYYPQYTGIVEISGVVDRSLSVTQMGDEHRVLVGDNDCIRNIEQLRTLLRQGYTGCVSYECFAGSVQNVPDPFAVLKASMDYVREAI